MWQAIAYCGLPPEPSAIASRFNLDPILIAALLALASGHVLFLRRSGRSLAMPLTGWIVAMAALVSPLCALSVALFSARIAQHMILIFAAAPLIASGLPSAGDKGLWPSAIAFLATLWFWHMPLPYDATFHSTALYWLMHVSLFGSAIWLWSALLGHAESATVNALVVGIATSMQMSLLGALLTFSDHAWFDVHYFTTGAWGLSPLADQQLGGALMWVPGCALFFWVALRSFGRLYQAAERRMPA